MMFALIALVQSAFACGPYGGMAFSEDGASAFENGDVIAMWTADGDLVEIPVSGEVIDMDFVGEELLVAFEDEDESFAVLFDEAGDELADWSPIHSEDTIRSIWVLPRGVMVTTVADGALVRTRLTDDLRAVPRITGRAIAIR
ncbi:MAG: hypothetical protein CL927_06905 [Deltaproteobacteria bacterium]|nr:hypothetical protein [Deltaproteobacteria bacterium]HCH65537.1 hypothetical protein [Deltaproteobacteria bacterium]